MKALNILGLVGQLTCDNYIWLNNRIQTRQGVKIRGSQSSVTNNSSLPRCDIT